MSVDFVGSELRSPKSLQDMAAALTDNAMNIVLKLSFMISDG